MFNNCLIICIIALVLFVYLLHSQNIIEGHRRRGRGRGGHRHGGARRHLYRHRRRHHYPRRWYHSFYDWRPWFVYGGSCKDGCANLGHGRWGCQYPGTGPNDCVFAEDCNWCGSYYPRWF